MNSLGTLTAEGFGNAIGVGLALFLVYQSIHMLSRVLSKRFPKAWLGIYIFAGALTLITISLTVLFLGQTQLSHTELFIGVSLFFLAHLIGLTLMAWRSWRQPNAGPADISSTS